MSTPIVKDVSNALNTLTGGRVPQDGDLFSCKNPFVVIKSSSIPGKEVMEIPGLVYGDRDKKVKKLAVLMTLNESHIELAGSLGVDALVAHHPVADAANSGGVTLKNYLGLYDIALFELHEAFHGLHPGIPYLHGHKAFRSEIAYAGIPGNIMFVGKTMEEVNTLGDMVKRINDFMGMNTEEELLASERQVRKCNEILETNTSTRSYILAGEEDKPVNNVLHIFPHTGFNVDHLEMALKEHPEVDTLLATISRVKSDHPLVDKCRELGLNLVIGNSHAMEILENGLPLAKALDRLLPGVEVMIFRERVTAVPLQDCGSEGIQNYADMICDNYLVK
ncbi:MAG: Nif3-like dinuclear metal center hexameric protein [Clostridiales bacterium]|nr:Nif3-like dinuclear metal center hexameric protein [Clostridiales bacterium]MCF8023496.1 Nif3-like dinuclear metal center hexameric protein [Clostridiales bacterium]